MIKALDEAKKAYREDNVPIGAVIVRDNQVIASAHNLSGALEHAEILAVKEALEVLGTRYLDNCDLYTTVEPCLMCSGSLISSRIRKVFFGAYDYKSGCAGSITDVFTLPFNHKIEYYGGIMEDECIYLLKQYFKSKREVDVR